MHPIALLGLVSAATSAHAFPGLDVLRRQDSATGWKRSTVGGVAFYGLQLGHENACGTFSKDTDMIIGIGPDFYGPPNPVSPKCFEHVGDLFPPYFDS